MGIILAVIGGLFVGFSNWAMRKSIDAGGSSKGFLAIQLTLSILISILLNPVRSGVYDISSCSFLVGMSGGIFLGLMLWGLGKSLESGPPGLSFAVLNSAAVVPALILVLLFGATYGFEYHSWNAAAAFLVMAGLFWAAQGDSLSGRLFPWVFYAAITFVSYTMFLVFMDWQNLLQNPSLPESWLLPLQLESRTMQWLMPSIYVGASLMHIGIYIRQVGTMPKIAEFFYGTIGAVVHALGFFLLLQATQNSGPQEAAMVFPIFSVSIIVACNLWGQILYKESVHWKATALCLLGLAVGTMDWAQLLG